MSRILLITLALITVIPFSYGTGTVGETEIDLSYDYERETGNELGEDLDYYYDTNETDLVVYRLFTRKNPTEFQVLKLNDWNLVESSNYNPNLPTKIYAPGWDNNGSIAYPTRDEYLLREDCNFIIVYWSDLQAGNGLFVVLTTQEAANHTGAFINFLVANGTPLSNFHLMGHSAGTHLAGGAGANVLAGKVPRITGLDPAKGAWTYNDTATRLDITDAEFVDIVHTNGGSILEGEIAFYEAMGHVDFYVNGGHKQPGCEDPDYTCCHHCRAVDLFAESINTEIGFVSVRCDSFEAYQNGTCDGNDQELMGDKVSLSARGTFYLSTNEQAPWAMG
ncbi:pancreatic lipase-related protein 2-like [Daphnia carinata]|uniref:pancreatic lipase-related protein 2-like n=1 Tax=Daphnia carinata TaxID=120202 RepID=UPI00257AD9C2|nr:pancreatic lipase-related protein 2-like [Daphnia carinata]